MERYVSGSVKTAELEVGLLRAVTALQRGAEMHHAGAMQKGGTQHWIYHDGDGITT